MIKKAISLLLFLAVIPAGKVMSDVTASDIASSVDRTLTHPYLFFTEADKPALRERIENDRECRNIFERLLAEANRLIYTPVTKVPPQPMEKGPQMFDSDEESSEFMNTWYSYRSSAYNLAFVYQMTGDERYAKKAFEFAREVCDMPSWVFRAHQFPVVYDRVMPWNVSDDQFMFTYEIVTSDTAAMMASVYDWIYPVLTKKERDWIRGGLMGKAIAPVRGCWDYHWWATAYRCNWCAWCCNGIGLASLALLSENPELTDMTAESYNRIGKTLDQIGVDGGWQEGGSYWGQTTRMSILFADALRRMTGGKFNLYHHPKLMTNPVNFPLYTSIPPSTSLNFEDAGGRSRVGEARLYNKIALESGNPEAAWIRANWFGEGRDIFDIIWPKNNVKPALPEKASIHFRSIDWVVMRSDFTDPEKVVVACKAGKNDDPHHGHLDCGQFMVYWRGQAFIADLGTGAYDEKYFGPEKYDTPHASSRGHNLIFVNGECQVPGKVKDKPMDESIGGKVLEFRDGASRDYTLLDPSNAYRKTSLKKWRRHIVHDKPEVTVVVDEIWCAPGAEIEARFHSDATQVPGKEYTILKGDKGTMAIIPVTDEPFAFRPERHAYQALFKNEAFKWIPYNGTVVTAKNDKTVIAHIILPVADEKEAARIAGSVKKTTDGSGGINFSLAKGGKKYVYAFTANNEGLVLTGK